MTEQQPGLSQPKPTWTIGGLGAEKPFPDYKEKLALFGQFVGDWVIEEARYPRPYGVELRSQGEIHFGWILDGRAVQDVFMSRDPDTGRAVPVGTTVRFYDPKLDAWQSTWISPVQELVQTFIGRKIGDEIVLESKTRDGYPEKWIFSEITKKLVPVACRGDPRQRQDVDSHRRNASSKENQRTAGPGSGSHFVGFSPSGLFDFFGHRSLVCKSTWMEFPEMP